MKKLVMNTGIIAATSVALLSTLGVEKAEALFIEASETFSVSEDIAGNTNNAPDDRQFKSYNQNGVDFLFGNSNIENLILEHGADVAQNSAIVGSYESEKVRGVVEFDVREYQETLDAFNAEIDQKVSDGDIGFIQGEAQKLLFRTELIASAALNFSVFNQGGLEDQAPAALGFQPFPAFRDGTVQVSYYGGGLDIIGESLFDYGNGVSVHGSLDDLNGDNNNPGDAIIGVDSSPLSSFTTAELNAGDSVSINISAAVSDALNQGWDALAFRLQALPSESVTNPLGECTAAGGNCGAITFHDFAIGAREVPTPAAILPTLFSMGVAACRKKKEEGAVDA